MKCINCNITLPDDATECFLCGAKVTKDVVRCPQCFVKIEANNKVCPKCGSNIEEKNKEIIKSTPKKKLTKRQIVLPVSILVVCIVLIISLCSLWYSAKFSSFKTEAREYVGFVDENIENITILADGYNDIYDSEWLVYAEKISGLESSNKEAIDMLKENRDKITYSASELSKKAMNKNDEMLIQKVFENYEECYRYVVAKKGKYPGYMVGYEKLLAEYKKSVKKLNKRIK